MEQKFTQLDDGRIKWEYFKEDSSFEDKEFGKVGVTGGYDYIIFDNKEQALAVLDRDMGEVQQNMDRYETDMNNNTYDFAGFDEKFDDLSNKVAQLHKDFNEVSSDKIYNLYQNDPQKYKKVLSEFNKSKDFLKEELSTVNSEYSKYLQWKQAKSNYEFYKEQYDKIAEQRDKLLALKDGEK